MIGSAPTLCLDISGVRGALAPFRFLLKTTADCLSVWLHEAVFALPMVVGKFPLDWISITGDLVNDLFCCHKEEVAFLPAVFK